MFYVKGGSLYAKYWQEDAFVLATDVSKVCTIRGWVPVDGNMVNDQGLIVCYLKTNGEMWYKSYCIQADLQKDWEIAREITEFSGTIDNIALFRTNDFRVGFMAEINGNTHWTLTERNYAGMSYWPELLTGKFNGFTAIDLIEIEYVDVYNVLLSITLADNDTLCIKMNLERADVVPTARQDKYLGRAKLLWGKFSQPLRREHRRIKDLVIVSRSMTSYYTPSTVISGEMQTMNLWGLTVAGSVDTENASNRTVGEATIYPGRTKRSRKYACRWLISSVTLAE